MRDMALTQKWGVFLGNGALWCKRVHLASFCCVLFDVGLAEIATRWRPGNGVDACVCSQIGRLNCQRAKAGDAKKSSALIISCGLARLLARNAYLRGFMVIGKSLRIFFEGVLGEVMRLCIRFLPRSHGGSCVSTISRVLFLASASLTGRGVLLLRCDHL